MLFYDVSMTTTILESDQKWLKNFDPCKYSDRLLDRLLFLNELIAKKDKVDVLEVQKAIYYAKKFYGDQKRQSGEPYYSHPLEVAYMLAEYASEEDARYFRTDLFVTSLLHDTIEDTELTFEMIQEVFGNIIASKVMDLTRIKKDGRKISSAEMIESLWLQKKKDLLLIKQLDRLHNMLTIGAKSQEKIQKIADETFNSFITFAMSEGNTTLEQTIYALCCKALSTEMISYELLPSTVKDSALSYIEDNCTHQLLSQVFQNVTDQTNNKK